jgi:hypothetical protein
MARRKKVLVLAKLAEDSTGQLKSMVKELVGDRPALAGDVAKAAHWSRRFAASGKGFAPRIRI